MCCRVPWPAAHETEGCLGGGDGVGPKSRPTRAKIPAMAVNRLQTAQYKVEIVFWHSKRPAVSNAVQPGEAHFNLKKHESPALETDQHTQHPPAHLPTVVLPYQQAGHP